MTAVLAAAVGIDASPAAARSPVGSSQALVGTYDGGQIELAAGIELRADGRFRYALSYGALDETAEGRWTATGDVVLLTTDPSIPPRFVLVEDRNAPEGLLSVKLDLPEGMSGQYFRAETRFADGTIDDRQLTEEGELSATGRPTGITLLLPVAGVGSGVVPLSGTGGHRLRFRFEPHDLGTAVFTRTALRIDGGGLVLRRHDRTIRFRRRPRSRSAG